MKNVLYLLILLSCVFCVPQKDKAPEPVKGKAYVQFNNTNISLNVDDTVTLSATYTSELNLKSSPSFIWKVSNEEIAQINSLGLLTAKKAGQILVTAAFESYLDTAFVTVLPKKMSANSISGINTVSGVNTTTGTTLTTFDSTVASVLILFSSNSLQIGTNTSLSYKALNKNSETIIGKNLTWKSSDTTIAKINSSGTIFAIKAGQTKITLEIDGVRSIEIPFTIVAPNNMKMGTFTGIGGHSCSGTVNLKYDTGGNLIIEMGSDFSVQSGPDLYIYLSNTASGSTINNVGLQVAALASNSGSKTYTVPSGTNIDTYSNVVIQCKQYAVTFGTAALK
jgi:hypothetical protein